MRVWAKRASSAAALGLLTIALLATPSSAQGLQNPNVSTPTTLYFHIFDTFNKFPINTQPMDVEFFEVGGNNFPTIASQGYDFNTIYGYSTAGPVEYDFIENGRPRFHPERGIAAEVSIDKSVQPFVFLYVDVRDVRGGDVLPNSLPSFTMKVTMREGDDFGSDEALNQGDIIMQGDFTAHIFDGHTAPINDAVAGQEGPDGHPILVPDADGIVEFAIPMTVAKDKIPKQDAYNIRIDWFQDPGEAAGEDEASSGYFRLAADANHLPRLELNIMNPVYIEFIHPQSAAGTILIHTGVNSPWGTYDVDVPNMTVEITGPSAPQVIEKVVSQGVHVHGLHDQAAQVTYLWDFRDEKAANGDYQVRLTVKNVAGTATATGTASFEVKGKTAVGFDDQGNEVTPAAGDEGSKDSPGLGVLAGLALLGAVAARRWRA